MEDGNAMPMLIVVGSSLDAEITDRPLAYRLREAVLRRLDAERTHGEPELHELHGLEPIVCTDLWYLNDTALHGHPAIALGDPATNAAAAAIASRLPTAFVVEQTLRVHLDPEFIELKACLWGVSPGATASAVDLFVERYLDGFLRGVLDLTG